MRCCGALRARFAAQNLVMMVDDGSELRRNNRDNIDNNGGVCRVRDVCR